MFVTLKFFLPGSCSELSGWSRYEEGELCTNTCGLFLGPGLSGSSPLQRHRKWGCRNTQLWKHLHVFCTENEAEPFIRAQSSLLWAFMCLCVCVFAKHIHMMNVTLVLLAEANEAAALPQDSFIIAPLFFSTVDFPEFPKLRLRVLRNISHNSRSQHCTDCRFSFHLLPSSGSDPRCDFFVLVHLQDYEI